MEINISVPKSIRYEKQQVSYIPNKGGVYLLYDEFNNLLYIGKAGNLYVRVSNHLNGSTETKDYYESIMYIEIFVFDKAVDREIYETYLINKLIPKYNKAKIYFDKKQEKKVINTKVNRDVVSTRADRKAVNTTIDKILYARAQILALQISSETGNKIHVNDLMEEGLEYILKKYEEI